jgi:integrase
VKEFSPDTAYEFEKFVADEHKIANDFPHLYKGEKIVKRGGSEITYKEEITERGGNTIAKYVSYCRAFFNYLVRYDVIDKTPYRNIAKPQQVYGTPFWLSIDERNKLYKHNLSDHPELEIQRDIFVFHCVVGCRVGDLLRLTKSNVVNGGIEYIAGKTKDGNPKTIRVPLNKVGLEILKKYKKFDSDKLLPFITEQKYNLAIKKALKTAKIERIVTIMDSKTRRDKQVPIHEVASSHLARRTLYANVYKKYKDPALAGSLTGHSPTSRSAQRYRDIDEDIKLELVKSLE